jgi:hypothetical protein
MLSGFFARLQRAPRPAPPTQRAPARIEVCPPELLPDTPGWARGLREWLAAGWQASAAAPLVELGAASPGATPLWEVRLEFVECLDDVGGRTVDDLAERLRRARSMRDLWHLREEVFSAISCHHDESEAHRRLARLNHHFPARTAPSGFGAFDALLARVHARRR